MPCARDAIGLRQPLVDPDVDLTSLPIFPLLRTRLFRSTFNLTATDAEFRAGLMLWVRSWDQKPAGSLPDDDHQLRRLAGLASQRHKWYRVRKMALHGWVLCDDGRLYHETIAEVVKLTLKWTGRYESGTQVVHAWPRTRRESRLKSMGESDEVKLRESPPIVPPKGDLFEMNGGAPSRHMPAPLDPRKLGHALPCACNNCTRWAALHRLGEGESGPFDGPSRAVTG